MVFGRMGRSDGSDLIAKRKATAGLIWRPGFYDKLCGAAATWAEPAADGLEDQTTFEAFYPLSASNMLSIAVDHASPTQGAGDSRFQEGSSGMTIAGFLVANVQQYLSGPIHCAFE